VLFQLYITKTAIGKGYAKKLTQNSIFLKIFKKCIFSPKNFVPKATRSDFGCHFWLFGEHGKESKPKNTLKTLTM